MKWLMQKSEKGLVDKSNISDLVKNSDLNTKLVTLATKAELKTKQEKILKLQAFDSSCFLVKAILKMMTCKFIQCFNQFFDVSNKS